MKWLFYGSNGWIGNKMVRILKKQGDTVIPGTSRVDNYATTKEEIDRVNPDRIVCAIGRTTGPGHSTIDYLEQPNKLTENLRDNLQGPLNLANISREKDIHMIYFGTGCIFEFDDTHPQDKPCEGNGFSEDDFPNFTGSQYSTVKGVTDNLMRGFSNVLNTRIRMPISSEINPRNFITKITKYDKVISVPNSMTVLAELLPILIDMGQKKITGTINLTNPGSITHSEILDMYKELVDPTFTYSMIPLKKLDKYTLGKRSNNYLETHRLQELYPDVKDIHTSVRETLVNMNKHFQQSHLSDIGSGFK